MMRFLIFLPNLMDCNGSCYNLPSSETNVKLLCIQMHPASMDCIYDDYYIICGNVGSYSPECFTIGSVHDYHTDCMCASGPI